MQNADDLEQCARGSQQERNWTMPDDGDTRYEHAARLTVNLIDHGHTPNELSEVVMEKLVEMAGESKMNIWHRDAGLSVASLAAMYRLYETGAGYCHSRTYADYELGRKQPDDNGISNPLIETR